jgi:Lipid-droplet associated hydrolase
MMKRLNFAYRNVDTVLLRFAAKEKDDDSRLTIVIFPGNPGIAELYAPFAEQLYNALSGCAAVFVLGYLGHTTESMGKWQLDASDGLVYSLHDQIEHKLAFLLSGYCARRRVVLIGHSIGSFMALHAANAVVQLARFDSNASKSNSNSNSNAAEQSIIDVANLQFNEFFTPAMFQRWVSAGDARALPDSIERCVGLMPTIQWLREGLSPAIRYAIGKRLLPAAAFVVAELPRRVKWMLLQRKSDLLGDAQRRVLLEHLRRSIVHNILYLARTEARLVREPPAEILDRLGSRCFFLFSPAIDQYTPKRQVEELHSQFPHLHFRVLPRSVPHAFVCDRSATSLVVRSVAQHIEHSVHNIVLKSRL